MTENTFFDIFAAIHCTPVKSSVTLSMDGRQIIVGRSSAKTLNWKRIICSAERCRLATHVMKELDKSRTVSVTIKRTGRDAAEVQCATNVRPIRAKSLNFTITARIPQSIAA